MVFVFRRRKLRIPRRYTRKSHRCSRRLYRNSRRSDRCSRRPDRCSRRSDRCSRKSHRCSRRSDNRTRCSDRCSLPVRSVNRNRCNHRIRHRFNRLRCGNGSLRQTPNKRLIVPARLLFHGLEVFSPSSSFLPFGTMLLQIFKGFCLLQ